MSQMTDIQTDRQTPHCEGRSQELQCDVTVRRTTAICGALILTYDIVALDIIVCLRIEICTAGHKIQVRRNLLFVLNVEQLESGITYFLNKVLRQRAL